MFTDALFNIYIPPTTNVGGIFLSRTSMTDSASKGVRSKDLYVGAVIEMFAHRFQVHDADDYTLRWVMLFVMGCEICCMLWVKCYLMDVWWLVQICFEYCVYMYVYEVYISMCVCACSWCVSIYMDKINNCFFPQKSHLQFHTHTHSCI